MSKSQLNYIKNKTIKTRTAIYKIVSSRNPIEIPGDGPRITPSFTNQDEPKNTNCCQ